MISSISCSISVVYVTIHIWTSVRPMSTESIFFLKKSAILINNMVMREFT